MRILVLHVGSSLTLFTTTSGVDKSGVSNYYYYYYYKRQMYPAVSEASRTGYKNYNVNTQTGPRKADTITNHMIH